MTAYSSIHEGQRAWKINLIPSNLPRCISITKNPIDCENLIPTFVRETINIYLSMYLVSYDTQQLKQDICNLIRFISGANLHL
jgi:hypothetical protein